MFLMSNQPLRVKIAKNIRLGGLNQAENSTLSIYSPCCGCYYAVEKQHAAIYVNAKLTDLYLTVIAYTRGLINVPRITDLIFC